MANVDIARALKDKAYFESLSAEDKKRVREASPTGEVDVSDEVLDSVSGGVSGHHTIMVTGTGTSTVQGAGVKTGKAAAIANNCNCNC
jgi:mersacidin/lichenicidin family type 2 lantibiotic